MCSDTATTTVNFEPNLWPRIKNCMSTYDRFLSTTFFKEYTEEQVRNMTHTGLGIKRATNLVKRVLGLCKFKMGDTLSNERYTEMLDYNAFFFSASYLHVAFPSTTTTERGVVSSVAITALENLITDVNASETVDDMPVLSCARFVDAMDMHIATFGKRLPISREEKILRVLAHYEDVASGKFSCIDMDIGIRMRFFTEYESLREKLIEYGLENEMKTIDDRISNRLANATMGE